MSTLATAKVAGELGVLVTCDAPMKQFILYLNEKEGQKFVLADLDSTHVVVRNDATVLTLIKEQVAKYIEDQNVPTELKSKTKRRN